MYPVFCRRIGLPALAEIPEHDFSLFAKPQGVEESGDSEKARAQLAYHTDNYISAVMLETGVIFHSIFIGIDLGINTDSSVVRPLMIALMFHQVLLNWIFGDSCY
jgi:hypothetical protein